MGLKGSPHGPWIFSGILDNPSSPHTISEDQSKLHGGLYVEDLVFYSSDPAQDFTPRTHPSWLHGRFRIFFRDCVYLDPAQRRKHSVHICQSAFTEFTAHWFSVQNSNKVTNLTLYRSGLPTDSIPPVDPLDPDLPRQRQVYQRIVGFINWLATCTRPDIAPVITFLVLYRNYPHPQHYKAAVHALKYLTTTNEYSISFHSKSSAIIQAFNHFPNHYDREAYTEATSPSISECRQLTV